MNYFEAASSEQVGERIVQLPCDPEMRADMGRKAKARVRGNYLLPRLLYDYLEAARQVSNIA